MTEAHIADRNALERLQAVGELPSFPPVALALLPLLAKDDVHIEEISEVIQRDAALAAELLRVANSPIFSLSWRVGTIPQAAMVMGIDFVKALSLTVAVRAFLKTAIRIGALRRCWRHSVASALLAERLAKAAGLHIERAYTAGLLHDLGRLGLMAAFPARYAEMLHATRTGAADLLELEREKFGLSHTEAGAWFAGKWRLPLDLLVVAERHHDEPVAKPDTLELLDLIQVACRLADIAGFAVADTAQTWTLDALRDCLPGPLRGCVDGTAESLAASVKLRVDAFG